jgi:hypothetical protein
MLTVGKWALGELWSYLRRMLTLHGRQVSWIWLLFIQKGRLVTWLLTWLDWIAYGSFNFTYTYQMSFQNKINASCIPRRPGFDPGSVHVGFVVDKVALGQVFHPVLRFSPVNFIPPVLHYLEKWKKLIIFLFIFITSVAQWASRLRCVRSFCCVTLLPPPPPKKKRLVLWLPRTFGEFENFKNGLINL